MRYLAGIAAVCLLIAACAGTSSSRTSGPAGLVTSTDGSFQTVIPAGLKNATGEQSVVKRLYAAAAPGIAIDVVRGPAPAHANLDAIAAQGLSGLKRTNPADHDFTSVRTLSIDGAPARSFSHLGLNEQGQTAVYAQLYVLHASWLYGIGAIAPPSQFGRLQLAMAQVVDHWRWTG